LGRWLGELGDLVVGRSLGASDAIVSVIAAIFAAAASAVVAIWMPF